MVRPLGARRAKGQSGFGQQHRMMIFVLPSSSRFCFTVGPVPSDCYVIRVRVRVTVDWDVIMEFLFQRLNDEKLFRANKYSTSRKRCGTIPGCSRGWTQRGTGRNEAPCFFIFRLGKIFRLGQNSNETVRSRRDGLIHSFPLSCPSKSNLWPGDTNKRLSFA